MAFIHTSSVWAPRGDWVGFVSGIRSQQVQRARHMAILRGRENATGAIRKLCPHHGPRGYRQAVWVLVGIASVMTRLASVRCLLVSLDARGYR